MIIALPSVNNRIDDHFGHCEYFTIINVESNKVINKQTIPSPQGCGCKSNIASVLQNMGVSVMLAGNMGDGAVNVLSAHNIKAIRGCSGLIDDVVIDFINGKIADSGQGCSHHGDHECPNH